MIIDVKSVRRNFALKSASMLQCFYKSVLLQLECRMRPANVYRRRVWLGARQSRQDVMLSMKESHWCVFHFYFRAYKV